MDVVGTNIRSIMMAGIPAKDTRPELMVRKLLHQQGFRYKLHDKTLPGKPDVVLPKFRAVIQVQGCFWHKHECDLFKWPSTRPDFWKTKLVQNSERDKVNLLRLHEMGWKSLVVWECALKGKKRISLSELKHMLAAWVINDPLSGEISGR